MECNGAFIGETHPRMASENGRISNHNLSTLEHMCALVVLYNYWNADCFDGPTPKMRGKRGGPKGRTGGPTDCSIQ